MVLSPCYAYDVTNLHGIKHRKLQHQLGEGLDAVEGGGGAAGLEDEPPLGDEHGALGQHVGGDLGVGHGGDDLALGQPEHLLQHNSAQIYICS